MPINLRDAPINLDYAFVNLCDAFVNLVDAPVNLNYVPVNLVDAPVNLDDARVGVTRRGTPQSCRVLVKVRARVGVSLGTGTRLPSAARGCCSLLRMPAVRDRFGSPLDVAA